MLDLWASCSGEEIILHGLKDFEGYSANKSVLFCSVRASKWRIQEPMYEHILYWNYISPEPLGQVLGLFSTLTAFLGGLNI